MQTVTKSNRVWGRSEDGSPYVTGMTVAELREALQKYPATDEVCLCVHGKSGTGGLLGKLKSVMFGAAGEMWLNGSVIDPSLEEVIDQ